MSTQTRLQLGGFLFVFLILASAGLLRNGVYGWTVFIVLPLCAGGFVSWTFRPATAARAVKMGALTGVIGCCCFLLLGMEGIICVVMSIPLIVPLSVLGSWLVYRAIRFDDSRTAAMALLLPASFLFDINAKPPVYAVQTSLVVNAPPEQVWKHVLAFPDIPFPREWYFRTGLAYPTRTRIEGSGPGAVRYCDFSTGSIVEPVVIWDEPHMLQFRVTATTAPMEEMGLYGRIYPKHLTGYFTPKKGQFTLSPLPHRRTLLEGTTWYQHGLWPAEYWRWWSDAIVHRIHKRVLEQIRVLSEQDTTAP
jgi:hypothetical protein